MSGVDPDINLHDWRRRKKEEAERLAGKKPTKGNEDIGYPIPGKHVPIRKFFEPDGPRTDPIKQAVDQFEKRLAEPTTRVVTRRLPDPNLASKGFKRPGSTAPSPATRPDGRMPRPSDRDQLGRREQLCAEGPNP